jgi:hypothetical protein
MAAISESQQMDKSGPLKTTEIKIISWYLGMNIKMIVKDRDLSNIVVVWDSHKSAGTVQIYAACQFILPPCTNPRPPTSMLKAPFVKARCAPLQSRR